jgi:hypothetical protein
MLYVAIDQHSKQLTVNERNEQGDVTLRRQVSTRPDAALHYVQELQQRGREQDGYVAIVGSLRLQRLADRTAQRARLPRDRPRPAGASR